MMPMRIRFLAVLTLLGAIDKYSDFAGVSKARFASDSDPDYDVPQKCPAHDGRMPLLRLAGQRIMTTALIRPNTAPTIFMTCPMRAFA